MTLSEAGKFENDLENLLTDFVFLPWRHEKIQRLNKRKKRDLLIPNTNIETEPLIYLLGKLEQVLLSKMFKILSMLQCITLKPVWIFFIY